MCSLHPTLKQRTPTGEKSSKQSQLEGDPITRGNELSELELEKQRALLLAQLKEPESD